MMESPQTDRVCDMTVIEGLNSINCAQGHLIIFCQAVACSVLTPTLVNTSFTPHARTPPPSTAPSFAR